MRSVTHFLRYSSLKCSKQTFTVRSANHRELLYFVCLPLRGERENWEKLFLSCGRFHSLLVAFRNSKTPRHSEIKQTSPSTKQDFSGEALSTKHRGLTSLTFMTRPGRRPSAPPYLHSVYDEIGHLTKYDAFRVNRGQAMNLEICFKLLTNVSNFETTSPKPYKVFKFLDCRDIL